MTKVSPPRSRRAANDPERREKIIAAARQTIARLGVADTTHRRIAETAGLPLGSLTYYFSGLEEIIAAAFEQLAEEVSGRFLAVMAAAENRETAREALVSYLCDDAPDKSDDMIVIYELYAYASRRTLLKTIMLNWMAASRRALEQHFTREEARALDAMIEGITIHNATNPKLLDRADIARIVETLTR